jgi:hypothetical protein
MNSHRKLLVRRQSSIDTISPGLKSRCRLRLTSSTPGLFHTSKRIIHLNYSNSDAEKIHQHSHWLGVPHLHDPFRCYSAVSGDDDWREFRYYFTPEKVPLRVYIKYEKILEAPKEKQLLRIEPSKTINKKGDEVWISTKYIDDAKRMMYMPENKAFFLPNNPQLPYQLRRNLSHDSIL